MSDENETEILIEFDDQEPVEPDPRRTSDLPHRELLAAARRESQLVRTPARNLRTRINETAATVATAGRLVATASRRLFEAAVSPARDAQGTVVEEAPEPARTVVQQPNLAEAPNVPEQVVRPPTDDSMYVRIDGRLLKVESRDAKDFEVTAGRLWDKEARSELPGDIKQAFTKAATGYVLSKHSKLQVQSLKIDDEGALAHVLSLKNQLASLRDHCVAYDIVDVFTIVLPVDSFVNSPRVGRSLLLFDAHPRLTPDVVANSCYWYNRYVAQEYVRENMTLTFKLLQNNTDEELWTKTLEEYNRYTPIQRGGPLMLILLLKRIRNSSETAITHLLDQLKKLKISELPGENVDRAVSMVTSTYELLVQASTSQRNYLPDDFPQTVLKIYQTSSVDEFNSQFAQIEKEALRDADLTGSIPEYPPVDEINNLASNSYARLKSTTWDAGAKGGSAFSATQLKPQDGQRKGGGPKREPTCWNCSGPHYLRDCPKPHDQAKIDAAKKKFQERFQGKPRTKMAKDGKPLRLNKRGLYVLDKSKWKKMQRETAVETLATALTGVPKSDGDAGAAAPAPAPAPTPAPAPASAPAAHTASADIRSALKTMILS